MGPAPCLHPPDVLGVPEVVAVGWLAQPVPLARLLAGMAASGLLAIMLAIVVAVIGEEKLAATTALTSFRLGTHRTSKPSRRGRELKPNQRKEEEPEGKKEEAFWREAVKEKAREENTISNRRF